MSLSNGNGSKIEAMTESIAMRLIARASMVATPVLLAVFAWVFVEAWSVQQKTAERIADKLDDLDRRVLVIETRTQVLDDVKTNGIPPRARLPADD